MNEVKELDDALTSVYAQKTGLTEQSIRDMMKAETFMNVTTALEKGFVDRVQSTGAQKPTAQHNQRRTSSQKASATRPLLASSSPTAANVHRPQQRKR